MAQPVGCVESWCRCCGTQHGDGAECPGELRATGPERHGWRILAETRNGPEVYGTLVAQAGRVWRARILTYPSILWVGPQGITLKFVASSPAEAERMAIAYIKDHCARRGFNVGQEVPAVESGPIDPEQDERTARSEEARASQRSLRVVRVRYGVGRASQAAETDDLSETGLFIRTDAPIPVGASLQLFLETPGMSIPLRGVVVWIREQAEDGRPRGMGIKLSIPHPRYLHYCRQRPADQDESTGR